MARNPNNSKKSSGIGGSSTSQLEGEALEKYNALKEELQYYKKLKNQVWGRRKKIKDILDNFDRVISEDVVSDVFGYSIGENEIDNIIDNSVIVSSQDIRSKIDGSSLPQITKTQLIILNTTIFANSKIRDISQTIDELGVNETYSILLKKIVSGNLNISNNNINTPILKALYINMVEDVEDDLL